MVSKPKAAAIKKEITEEEAGKEQIRRAKQNLCTTTKDSMSKKRSKDTEEARAHLAEIRQVYDSLRGKEQDAFALAFVKNKGSKNFQWVKTVKDSMHNVLQGQRLDLPKNSKRLKDMPSTNQQIKILPGMPGDNY